MNGKTMLLLGLAVLGGITLGAVGMQYFGSWEGVAQAVGALRQPGSPAPVTTPAAVRQPTEQAAPDAHEGHAHEEHPAEQGATPHAHNHDESGHAAPTGAASSKGDTQSTVPPTPAAAKGARPSRPDAHSHGEEKSAKPDAHGHGEDAHGHGKDAHGDEEKKLVRWPAAKVQQLGIKVAVARAESLQTSLTLPGAIVLNADRRVHIVSRIPGIVQEIRKQLGDPVRAGEVMAVIDSRELADTKAAYLAARERVTLTETTFTREKDLWEKKISPAEDYLKAKQALAEVRIELQVASQKLRALGFSEASVQQLSSRANASLTRYEVVAPLAGTVIQKHIAVGEMLKDDTEAFMVADLSTVWVDLNISAKDLLLVRKGQRVVVAADPTMQAEGTVSYISPMVSDETRTVVTRVVLPNPDGRWRPGLFITATLTASDTPVAVLIPKTATQTIDGQPHVFVQTPEGFAPRPVTLGRANETHVEITTGLQAGERYAMTETFILKAELGKGAASHEH
ncbi:MAG: efflux RND transporter periplasmic adaptor subunit [Candidatus Tectimicrobiota bacterium]